MIEKLQEFYKEEYNSVSKCLQNCPSWTTPRDIVFNSIDRCLGAAFFCQKLTNDFDNIDRMYSKTRMDLLNLLKEYE